jgi:hypothetical protein
MRSFAGLRVFAAAPIQEVAKLPPLSEPRAQQPKLRLWRGTGTTWTAAALAVAAALTAYLAQR